jgi:hypothetical protein
VQVVIGRMAMVYVQNWNAIDPNPNSYYITMRAFFLQSDSTLFWMAGKSAPNHAPAFRG